MKSTLFTILVMTSIYSHGQETVRKKTKNESFHVLKDQPEIKQGPYEYIVKSVVVEKGQFDNGKRIGIWEFYSSSGVLEQKYNYTTNDLLFNETDNQFANCKMLVDGKPTIKPDVSPIFIGGLSRYQRFMMDNLKYPKKSKAKGIEGREAIIASLSNEGQILSVKNHHNITDDMDQEAIRLISELPHEWIPAKHQSQNVDVMVVLPVIFVFQEVEENWARTFKHWVTSGIKSDIIK